MRILQPAGWPRPRGYSNGVATRGELVFVAGQIGWDTNGKFPSNTMGGQARVALQNVLAVLHEAGAKPEHIVRMTWYVTSREAYMAAGAEIGVAFREIIGSYNAAMSAVQVCALMEPEALVEIEVTAVIPD
jgi:enamine deaminase RidA (YjgF/YER057c/UK114 family)